MNRPRKFTIIIGLLLIVILCVLYKVGGYVPVIGEQIANKKIAEYEAKVYHVSDVINTGYSLNSGMYEGKYEKGSSDYFLSYALNVNGIWDEYQIEKWNDQLRSDFRNIRKKMPENIILKDPYILGHIDTRDYSQKIQRIYLPIYNTEHLSMEESKKKAAEITAQIIALLGDQYSIAGVQIWYYDRNGGYTICKTEKTSKLITYEWLLKNTKKMDELGETEQKWISGLKSNKIQANIFEAANYDYTLMYGDPKLWDDEKNLSVDVNGDGISEEFVISKDKNDNIIMKGIRRDPQQGAEQSMNFWTANVEGLLPKTLKKGDGIADDCFVQISCCDIDEDGTKEVLVSAGDKENANITAIYEYAGSGEIPFYYSGYIHCDTVVRYKGNNIIWAYHGNFDDDHYAVYMYNGEKIEKR